MAAHLSRRSFLINGSARGAVGALGVVSPAAAWNWAPANSIAGTGDGGDPATRWDPQADAVVASLYANGQVEEVNDLLATWTRNDQPLPQGLPAQLHDFIESARRRPVWTDTSKLADAFSFYERCGLYLGVLYGVGSGMMSCAIPREARAVYYSAGGADMKDRIAKTATLGYDIGEKDAFGNAGSMIVTCVKTRLVHAAVRHLLPGSKPWQDVADEQRPISQADIMVTWHSLVTFAYNKMVAWDIEVSPRDADGFLHVWQVTAALLGVEEQYIPASWTEATRQSRQIVDPLLAPTAEGKKLCKELMKIATGGDRGVISRPMTHSFTRYTLGDQIAEWIGIPPEPVTDPMVRHGWPPFVKFREGGSNAPLAPQGYWIFDEFLRQSVLFYLGGGQPINITLPTGNNPEYD